MTEDGMEAAITAVVSGRSREPFALADGTVLDLDAALRASQLALVALADEQLSDTTKRAAVHIALVQAVGRRS